VSEGRSPLLSKTPKEIGAMTRGQLLELILHELMYRKSEAHVQAEKRRISRARSKLYRKHRKR